MKSDVAVGLAVEQPEITDQIFMAHVEALRPKLEALLTMPPVKPFSMPRTMPKAGIYVLSEAGHNLYVGRSNNIRARIHEHSRPSSDHKKAAFALQIARKITGNIRATYKKGSGSRSGLIKNGAFLREFVTAKARIRQMDLRYVEESDPVRQTLLEVYIAVVLKTPYNDFNNH